MLPITEADVDRMMMPHMEAMPPTTLPANEAGTMSPYPTVVMVMTPHQNALGRLWNSDSDFSVPHCLSVYKIRLEKIMTGMSRISRRRPS